MKKYLLGITTIAVVFVLAGAGCSAAKKSDAMPMTPDGEPDIDAIIESGNLAWCDQLGEDFLVEACKDEIANQPAS